MPLKMWTKKPLGLLEACLLEDHIGDYVDRTLYAILNENNMLCIANKTVLKVKLMFIMLLFFSLHDLCNLSI